MERVKKNPIYCCYEWDCAAGHYQDTEDNSNTTTEKEENNNGIAFVSNGVNGCYI